jgi:hypothetical protein
MNTGRTISLSLILMLGLTLVRAQDAQKLLGSWKTTVDYETVTLSFTSEKELVLNGETYPYTLSENNIVVDYQYYPFAFKGEDLFVTAEGIEYKFTRTGEAKKKTSGTEGLLGKWQNKGEYGMHRLTFHSETQAEYDGEWVGFTIRDNAFIVDYEKYPFKLDGDVLMIKWPGESDYRKFSRVID